MRSLPGNLLLMLFSAMFVVASCASDRKTDHMPREKMHQILLDINIAETYSTLIKDSMIRKRLKNVDSLANFYKDIFEHHHITRAQFEQSMTWYKSHPDEMDSVYNDIVPEITSWQQAK